MSTDNPDSQSVSSGWILALSIWFAVLTGILVYGLIQFWPQTSSDIGQAAASPTPTPNQSASPGPAASVSPSARPSPSAGVAASPSPSASAGSGAITSAGPSGSTGAGQGSIPGPSPPPGTTGGATAGQTTDANARPVAVSVFGYSVSPGAETRLLILILLAGALGSMVAVLRSFSWHVGNRNLGRSWVPRYLLLPAVGSALSVIFYVVIRGGFAKDIDGSGPFGFVALAALIGMFSEQAAEKLKQISETIFTAAPKGAGALLTATGISPTSGPQAGGTAVTITGSGFAPGATVSFGGVAASGVAPSADGKTISAKTPAAAKPGPVKVEVKNSAGQTAAVPSDFTYV